MFHASKAALLRYLQPSSGEIPLRALFLAPLLLASAPLAAQPQKALMTQASDLPAPPRAEQRPHAYERHGYRVEDPYHWLKDQGYPKVDDADVLAYLKAENAYFEAAMKPHGALVETLFQEMKGRIKEDESSVPVKDGDWLYWWAFKPGAQYRTWYRSRSAAARTRCCWTSRRRPRARNISGSARWR
jgi:oligopeptidase B